MNRKELYEYAQKVRAENQGVNQLLSAIVEADTQLEVALVRIKNCVETATIRKRIAPSNTSLYAGHQRWLVINERYML